MHIENLTPQVERILKMAAIEAEKDSGFVGTNHVLIGMMLEGKNGAAILLKDAGFTVEGMRGDGVDGKS